MPTEHEYSLQDLADLADVTPRTVRYYVAQGLLPSPEGVGPGAHYRDGHLARLRLVRQLQREHLPLAEIRARLAGLDDAAVLGLLEAPAPSAGPASAVDYVREILAGGTSRPAGLARRTVVHWAEPAQAPEAAAPAMSGPGTTSPSIERSQWDRIALTTDVELHVRRPLSRLVHKRVERLVAIARELLEEDLP